MALRNLRRLHLGYRDVEGRYSQRDIRPLALSFFGPVWLLAAWCDLRQDFRTFRLDRIEQLVVLDDKFRPERGKTIQDYLKNQDR